MPTKMGKWVGLRMPEDLVERYRAMAEADDRSMSSLMRVAMRQYADRRDSDARRRAR